jgi:hypothetical protein
MFFHHFTLSAVQPLKVATALRRELDRSTSAISIQASTPDPSTAFETAKHPANKARVQIQIALDVVSERWLALRDFEQNACFGQGHTGLEKIVVQGAYKPGEKAIEAPDRRDSIVHESIIQNDG